MEQGTPAKVARGIAARLTAAGVSQRQLSELTGIPLATLNRSLTGHRVLNLAEFEAIANALGVRPSALVREAEVAA